jgi:aminopeptidase N
MIRFVASLLFLTFFMRSVWAQSPEILCKQVDDIARAEMRQAQAKQNSAKFKKTASSFMDIHYHRCVWQIDPAVSAIAGTVTSYFTLSQAASTIVFDLTDNMLVDQVMYHGIALTYTRPMNNTLQINLGKTILQNESDSISITYHGVPNSSGFGSFVQTNHSGTPIVWTLSEPYGARDWWPCNNALEDKIDSIDVFITTPKAYKAVSNGLRQSELLSADTLSLTTHWRHRYPIVSYLVCLAVTNYTEFNKSVQLGQRTLPMQTFCYPESYADFYANSQSTLDAIAFYHFTFGDYPFIKEKYGHTQFSWGGGEEHQTNSFVINPGESLCAHELAHQWFGDKITCASWKDIWLNEGFATHLASMFMESRHPENIYANRKAEIGNITSVLGGSVQVDDTTSVGRIFDSRLTYTKGSHLLYMLRFKLGDVPFLNGIRAYLNDPKLRYGFARTNDLKKHLEDASGVSLDSFFRQWFEGQGYPSYQVAWAQIGPDVVKIQLNQTTSHASVPFFALPVALKFTNSLRDTTVVVDHQSNGAYFVRNIGFVADSVFVDPEYWLISKNNTVTKLAELALLPGAVNVYPSPCINELNVQLQSFTGNSLSLLLHNVLGQTMLHTTVPLYQGKAFLNIPVAQLSSGHYILTVIAEDGFKTTQRVVKY